MADVKSKNVQDKKSANKDLNSAKEEKEMRKVKGEQIRQAFEECLKDFEVDGELPFY